MADEARNLKQYKELPENSMLLLMLHLHEEACSAFTRRLNTIIILQSESMRQTRLLTRRGSMMNTLILRISQV